MFIKKRYLLAITLFSAVFVTTSFADLVFIPDITVQTVQGYRSSPPYGWSYKYDIGFADLELNVQLRILFVGDDPGATLEQTWENGIEDMWSRKFDIVDGDFHYHVNFDAVFFDLSPQDPVHHVVTVTSGQGGGDMLHWYTTCDWGEAYNGKFAAHETGHMFSLYDEYTGGAVNPVDPVIDYTSIMGDLRGVAYERHYQPFLDWLEPAADGRLLYLAVYDPDWINPVIPEPAAICLLAFGCLIIMSKRRK